MDACKRQVKSHITYEPNWEKGYNLQIHLVPVIEMIMTWSCSNV